MQHNACQAFLEKCVALERSFGREINKCPHQQFADVAVGKRPSAVRQAVRQAHGPEQSRSIEGPFDKLTVLIRVEGLCYPYPSSLRRTTKYASFLGNSEALHMDIFHQPLRRRSFDSLDGLLFLYVLSNFSAISFRSSILEIFPTLVRGSSSTTSSRSGSLNLAICLFIKNSLSSSNSSVLPGCRMT